MNLILRVVAAILMAGCGWFASENADLFEYVLVDAGWAGWFLSAYFSRILTGSGIALAALILVLPGNKTIILRSALIYASGMLLISILQPLMLELTRCYVCMYELKRLSVYQGIGIWLLVLLLLVFVYRTRNQAKSLLPAWSAWVLVIGLLSIPFVLNYPAHWAVYGELADYEVKRDLKLSRLDTVKFDTGNFNYTPGYFKGRHILVLASTSCVYCARAAYKFHIMKKRDPDFPVTFLINGDRELLPTFLERTRMENVPYQFFNGALFNELCEGSVPRIFLIDNGITRKEYTFWGITPATL